MYRNTLLVVLAFAFVLALPVHCGAGYLAHRTERQHRRRHTRELLLRDHQWLSRTHTGRKPTMPLEYGTTRSYGSQTPLAAAGNGLKTISVNEPLSGTYSH